MAWIGTLNVRTCLRLEIDTLTAPKLGAQRGSTALSASLRLLTKAEAEAVQIVPAGIEQNLPCAQVQAPPRTWTRWTSGASETSDESPGAPSFVE